MNKPKLESEITKDVLNWLNKQADCVAFKYVAGRFGKNGVPDVFGSCMGVSFYIEMKQPGNEPTPIQTETIEMINNKGAIALWTDNIESVKELINSIREGEAMIQVALKGGGIDNLNETLAPHMGPALEEIARREATNVAQGNPAPGVEPCECGVCTGDPVPIRIVEGGDTE